MKDKIVKFLLFVSLTLMFVYFNYQLKFIDLSFTFENGLTFPILFIIMIVLTLMFLLILEPIPISFITITVPIILIIFSNLSNMNIEQALSGFSNGANITIMSMFVFSAGMQKSGLIQLLGDKISFIVGKKENKQVFIISLLTGSFAGFINNTPVVAALIPMVKDLAKKSKISMSKLLMPLSYSAMLGGTITLIGTSTNLLANQVLTRQLGRSYKMFEFTILGVICLVIGIIYLMTIGSKLIPDRMKRQNDLTDEYHMQNYLTKVLIKKDCEFVNQTVKSVQEEYEKLDFDIIKLIRDDEEFMQPLDSKMIRPDDFLIIRASHKILFKLVKKSGIKMMSELVINDDAIEQKEKGEKMVEAVIPNNSSLIGKTLDEMNFLKKYNCNVLAIRRGKELTRNELDDFIFKPGDLILILVTNDTFKRLRYNDNFIVGREYDAKNYDTKDMIISLGILLFFVISVAFQLLEVPIAALIGAISMVFFKIIEKEEFFNAIDWNVYFLLAGLIPLGIAIEQTGADSFLASKVIKLSSVFPPLIFLMILYLITSLLASIINNSASVLLMLPIGIEVAQQLGANPFAFAITTTFAASAAFATPVGYQTNLMIYSSGGFKFKDFLIVGGPLQILMSIMVPIFVKYIWGI